MTKRQRVRQSSTKSRGLPDPRPIWAIVAAGGDVLSTYASELAARSMRQTFERVVRYAPAKESTK